MTEVIKAVEQVRRLGLPLHGFLAKNWDSLAALDLILNRVDPEKAILDAGAETYSRILPWLQAYGYANLIGINLSFPGCFQRGSIRYEKGDIVNTTFPDCFFGAVTCLSVIEHGVDLRVYFREMARILKPGGILVTSTDYYPDAIDTQGKYAYGVPVHIFDKDEILRALETARSFGLKPAGMVDLDCREKVVYWQKHDLRFTFLNFLLEKQQGHTRVGSSNPLE